MAGIGPLHPRWHRSTSRKRVIGASTPDCYIFCLKVNHDLLFYHLKLRRYVVIELKARAFAPGDVGQLNLYLSAVDDLLRHPDDQPTIGLLLCRNKNKLVAEYALRGLDQSIAVAAWQTQLTETLPEDLRSSLPSIEEIEAELANETPPV